MAADTPRKTRASEALRSKFEARHGAQKDCHLRTKIPQNRLSRIADGKAFPRADEGSRLEQEGIPVHWWDEEPLDAEQPANGHVPTGTG